MDVTPMTWIVALTGILMMALLSVFQLIALVRPRSEWTIVNVYGGSPASTDPTAYFAFNQGYALADPVFWAPLQFAGSIGMLLGQRWGFLLALVASVPYWYSAVPLFVWDREMGFRKRYWAVTWGVWPLFGIIAGVYCFVRLLE